MRPTLLVDVAILAHGVWRTQPPGTPLDVTERRLIETLRLHARNLNASRRIAAVELTRSFRHQVVDHYKGTRPARDPELVAFLRALPELASAADYEVWHAPNHEADDVMATFAATLSDPVLILTTDRDLYACVSERVRVVTPRSEHGAYTFVDEAHVNATFSVPPAKVPFYKALVGDVSDNLKGVNGLGRKKAEPLLARFDTLHELYLHLPSLDGKIRRLLLDTPRAYVEACFQAATLVMDAPLERLWPLSASQSDDHETPTPLSDLWAPVGPLPIPGPHELLSPQRVLPPEVTVFLNRHAVRLPGTCTEDLSLSLHSLRFGAKLKILTDPLCPTDVLRIFSTDANVQVRRMVPWHQACPVDLLEALASDELEVQIAVVQNRRCSPETITRLAVSTASEPIKRVIAGKARLPYQVIQTLMHAGENVLTALAHNESLSAEERFRAIHHLSDPAMVLDSLARHSDEDVRRLVAGYHRSSLVALEQLACDESFDVRAAVMGNPSCSAELLMLLTHDENPDLLCVLARNKACPGDVLDTLARHDDEDVRVAVVDREDCPAEVLYFLACDVSPRVYHAVMQHPTFASDTRLRQAVATHLECPDEILLVLSDDENDDIRAAVARHPWLPTQGFALLSGDSDEGVQQALERHFTDDMEGIFTQLGGGFAALALEGDVASVGTYSVSDSGHAYLPEHLAGASFGSKRLVGYSIFPWWQLELNFIDDGLEAPLNEDELTEFLGYLAVFPGCFQDAVADLIKENVNLRATVARDPDCPTLLLHSLIDVSDGGLVEVIASHPNADESVLRKIMVDSYGEYDWLILASDACSDELAMEMLDFDWRIDTVVGSDLFRSSINLRKAVALAEDCPDEILWQLTADADESVVAAVGRRADCSEELLEALAQSCSKVVLAAVLQHARFHVSAAVRATLARNEECDFEWLIQLSEDHDDDVKEGVAGNGSCPAPVLRKLASEADTFIRCAVAANTSCPEDVLLKLSDDEKNDVRCAVAKHPVCPVAALEELSQDLDEDIRMAVAGHPSTPEHVLLLLSCDSVQDVRVVVDGRADLTHSVRARLDQYGWLSVTDG